ncbi:integrator complex subunit 12-like [Vespa crabro]|uniref:integrator complex subunit 12-like n=1 Tax=Vespa crabro TaxID=7445 RepID=UPI001F026B6C|nr:integrator complex subunit 12-like [Vespa crabro]
MYTDNSSEIDEEFFDALALLRSNEEDSAEKLRKMLDKQIERRYGTSKTLAFRMPKEFLQKERTIWKTYSRNSIKLTNDKNQVQNDDSNDKNNDTNDKSVEIVEVNFKNTYEEEYEEFEKIDVPRISIPDDISNDGALCKICNGTKLGPLILLECQECQEIYHPLCHNPAVVDIDVYDPRLVWRCGKCAEVTASTYGTTLEEERKGDVKKITNNKYAKSVNVEKKKRCVKMYEREKVFKRRH